MDFYKRFPSRRSNIIAHNGVVATSQPLGAQAGLDILKAGGNALDAAIATIATMCVVEPCSTGIGGDAFALIWIEKEKTLYGLNASGPAPINLSADQLRAAGHEKFPTLGGQAVTVPGSLRGWESALDRFGSFGLDRLLQPAIDYASNGYPVSEIIAAQWGRSTEKMSKHADSKRVWLPNGRAPKAGERFRNPEFARTLKTIAENGVTAFYEGEIAAAMAKTVQEDGGWLTEEDLANYAAEWVSPISVPYGDGYEFFEIPPNGQGLTALIALNLVKSFDLSTLTYGSVGYNHLLMECIKLAFADAAAYIGDMRVQNIPVEALLSAEYTKQRQSMIQPNNVLSPFPGTPSKIGDTVYLTTADREGNMVSWIQSLYMGFGSGLTAGTTGIQLQNRGANFSLVEGHPNEAAGGKRPYHTIIPGFITRNGEAWSSFGVMGGFMQPQGHLQVGLNLVEFGMSPQAALDAPRLNWQDHKRFGIEAEMGAEVLAGLQALGHELMPQEEANKLHYGGGQVIVRQDGVLIGGSEPRADGCAVGF